MRWFGQAHGAPYEAECEHVPRPLNELCAWCSEPITADDDGLMIPELTSGRWLPYHYECQMRSILGGINHQRGICTCCGGNEPPDPFWLTRRQAAKLAEAYGRRPFR